MPDRCPPVCALPPVGAARPAEQHNERRPCDEEAQVFDLRGKVALVTGGGQHVGAQIARTLAAHGAAVAVNDLVAERAQAVVDEIAAAGGTAATAVADVADGVAVRAAVEQVRRALGPVSIIVNNAGIPAGGMGMAPFADSDPASWDPYVRLNVYGVLHCTHAVLPDMIAGGWGRVVTISSDSARVGDAGLVAYAGSKAFGPGMMRSLAKEVGRYGITCNSLSLGTVPPPGVAEQAADRLAKQVRRYPAGRLGTPADVAAAVLWLASEEAGWVTGQTVPVNGGYAAG
jgi:NAD(P)-dependent dehydrogenase (short-subunit alcohol dehydrogenase family)